MRHRTQASLFWEKDNTLVIGWADMVKIAVVRTKELASGETTRIVDVVALYALYRGLVAQCDQRVGGMCPHMPLCA